MSVRSRMLAALCGLLVSAGLTCGQEIEPLAPPAVPAGGEVEDFGVAPPVQEEGWIRADYLLGWFRRGQLGNLVTSSPAGTDKALAGVLGQPGTTTLLGGAAHDNLRSGLQISAGIPINSDPRRGVEVGFLLFDDDVTRFSAQSTTGDPILARPITNAVNGQQEAILIAFPGVATGSIDVLAQSRAFFASHLDFTETFVDTGAFRLESIVGYRFFRYAERLRINQVVQPGLPAVPGTTINSIDEFSTRNHFHGLDLGLRGTVERDNLSLSLLAKVAAGRNLRRVVIQGSQATTVPPDTTPLQRTGGLLALSSNIGTYDRDDYSVVPELGVDFGWRMTPWLRVHAGYDFLFMTRLARAADQIDFNVNPTLFPGSIVPVTDPARPQFNLRASDLWIQSLRLGLELTF